MGIKEAQYFMKLTATRLTLILAVLLGSYGLPAAANNALLGMLTTQLGINEQQASGGIKAIMDLAKQHLSDADYARILAAAPDLGALLAPPAAPVSAVAPATTATSPTPVVTAPADAASPAKEPSTTEALLQYAGSWFGGTSSLGQMAQLAQVFTQLGIPADTVAQFMQIALGYVNSTGGQEVMNLLSGALKF